MVPMHVCVHIHCYDSLLRFHCYDSLLQFLKKEDHDSKKCIPFSGYFLDHLCFFFFDDFLLLGKSWFDNFLKYFSGIVKCVCASG